MLEAWTVQCNRVILQLMFVFTVGYQRQSELVPCGQEDFYVFLVPGFKGNCSQREGIHISTIISFLWERFSLF